MAQIRVLHVWPSPVPTCWLARAITHAHTPSSAAFLPSCRPKEVDPGDEFTKQLGLPLLMSWVDLGKVGLTDMVFMEWGHIYKLLCCESKVNTLYGQKYVESWSSHFNEVWGSSPNYGHKMWFAKAVLKELKWPAWSTGLNPTEHFLVKLKHSSHIAP